MSNVDVDPANVNQVIECGKINSEGCEIRRNVIALLPALVKGKNVTGGPSVGMACVIQYAGNHRIQIWTQKLKSLGPTGQNALAVEIQSKCAVRRILISEISCCK